MGFITAIAQKGINAVWHATHSENKATVSGVKRGRKFEAASSSRLVNEWLSTNQSIDYELKSALRQLRARSRDLVNNNGYGKNFIRKVKSNVVGSKGIILQNKARRHDGSLDDLDNIAIEQYYKRCGKKGNFDVTGKLSRADGERLFIETVARDGEFLGRIVRGYDNEVGFAVQFLDVDLLDEQYNLDRHSVTGNAIKMSIEYNSWGKAVAYHLLTNHPGGDSIAYGGQRYERVLAEDIIHEFIAVRGMQGRGIPWMHAAMVSLNDLGGYREAAVIAARVGASKMGFYTSPDGDPSNVNGTDSNGDFIQEAEPAHFDVMPEGYTLETWDPTYPHDQFETFNKACLRGISSGIGVAYHSLANDLEGVNFASSRSGTLEERDEWMVIQDWMICSFNIRIFEEQLRYGLASQNLKLPLSQYNKFNSPYFQARRWMWVDPKKDMDGHSSAMDYRVRSPQQVIREQGSDPEEVLDEWEQWFEMLEKRNIPKEPANAGFLMSGENEDDDKENDDS